MRTIVAGCRDYTDYEAVKAVLDGFKKDITEVISGGATRS